MYSGGRYDDPDTRNMLIFVKRTAAE